MQTFDFCFAWSWPYDDAFANLLRQACQEQQITLLQVTPDNIDLVLEQLSAGELYFRVFFDRASDGDARFAPLAAWAYQQNIDYLNRFWLAQRSWDKATMHHLFTRSGLDAPYTIILPSYQDSPGLPDLDLSPLGEIFIIKPAHGGGGAGVLAGAFNWEQVLQARQQFPKDQYLLQAQARPTWLDGRLAWFRLLYCLEQFYPCWWDPHTHIYTPLTTAEQSAYGLEALSEICLRIAQLCHLELFSSEVALTESKRFLVVDYINDPIDLRPRSLFPQGVPDPIVNEIVLSLAAYAAACCARGATYAG